MIRRASRRDILRFGAATLAAPALARCAAGRSPYMGRWRWDSLVGGSPATSRPWSSSRDSRAGSSRPSATLVGVISQPSSSRALILPELPKVRPRSKIDWP